MNVSIYAGSSLVLALHLSQLSILVSDFDHGLLSGLGNILCTGPVVHLSTLHTLCLILVSLVLLESLACLQGLELLGLTVELLGKSLLLRFTAEDLHKSLFTDHLHSKLSLGISWITCIVFYLCSSLACSAAT